MNKDMKVNNIQENYFEEENNTMKEQKVTNEKKKEKFFETYSDEMNIDYATEQTKLKKALTRIKIGIVLGILSIAFWIINGAVDVSMDSVTENIALWSGLIAYIVGGSIRWAFKFIKFVSKVAYWVTPSFFGGIVASIMMCLPALLIVVLVPLICILLNYIETRRKLSYINKQLAAQ